MSPISPANVNLSSFHTTQFRVDDENAQPAFARKITPIMVANTATIPSAQTPIERTIMHSIMRDQREQCTVEFCSV